MMERHIRLTLSSGSKLHQAGIGLPAAIFVITLMAAIAVAINLLVGQNAQTFDEEID